MISTRIGLSLRAAAFGSMCAIAASAGATPAKAQSAVGYYTLDSADFAQLFFDRDLIPKSDCASSGLGLPNGANLKTLKVFPAIPDEVRPPDKEADVHYNIFIIREPVDGERQTILEEEITIYDASAPAEAQIVLKEQYKFGLAETIDTKNNRYTMYVCVTEVGALDLEDYLGTWGRIRYRLGQ